MFKPVITPDVVAAYGVCRRKAFLLLHGDTGNPHEYTKLINAHTAECQKAYLRSFDASVLQIHKGQRQAIEVSMVERP